uniref:Uncharacterized protein n=1 Tax=Caenorhabditis japonica TaxID=281687 RepID=A0A8R1E6A5_CAEJA
MRLPDDSKPDASIPRQFATHVDIDTATFRNPSIRNRDKQKPRALATRQFATPTLRNPTFRNNVISPPIFESMI